MNTLRTVVAAMVAVLGLAVLVVGMAPGVAGAHETAWVLWAEIWIKSKDGINTPSRYELLGGGGTVKECEAARLAWLADHEAYAVGDTLERALTRGLQRSPVGNEPTIAHSYLRPVCLPASIDPRSKP